MNSAQRSPRSDDDLAIPGRARPYVMAHRGSRATHPENTMSAFLHAFAVGAAMVETDLWLTADDQIVCIHDATVDRTTDGHGPVTDLPAAALRRLDAAAGTRHPREPVPFLRELLAVLPPNAAVALELKDPRFVEPDRIRQLRRELEAAGAARRAVVLSFSPATLRAVQRHAGDLPTGLISMRRFLPHPGFRLTGPAWPWLYLNPFYVSFAHRRGQLVCPLDPEPLPRLRWYLALGCDAVLADDPAATLAALARRRPPTAAVAAGVARATARP